MNISRRSLQRRRVSGVCNQAAAVCCFVSTAVADTFGYNPSMKTIVSDAGRTRSWRAALVDRQDELWQRVREHGEQRRQHLFERATGVLADAIQWLAELPEHSIHAV